MSHPSLIEPIPLHPPDTDAEALGIIAPCDEQEYVQECNYIKEIEREIQEEKHREWYEIAFI